MKSVLLKLPDALNAKLSTAAKQRGVSKSAMARKALESYLAGTNGVPQVSCYELGKDLWGSLKGPGDLSHNAKYMEGYGR